jgi:adenylate cyclase
VKAQHRNHLALVYQEIGRLAFRAGDNAGAIAWAERALAEAARADEQPSDRERVRERAATQAQAYNTLGVALARTGQPRQAVDRIKQSIALAEGHDLLQATCRGYTNLSVLESSLDPPRSIETCLRGLEVASRVGDLAFQSAARQSGGGLLRAHQSLRGGGYRSGGNRNRPRPPARPS